MSIQKYSIPTMGIHLGSSFSCVALKHVDQIMVTKECQQIPSIVVFKENHHYVGHEALHHAEVNSANTITNFMQLLGRNFDDEVVQKWVKIAPYKIVSDQNNKPKILVTTNGESKSYYPEDIAALILRHLTQMAKLILNQTVTHAVITVPAYFDDQQRHHLKLACQLAGISDLRLISSPYASGFAYAVHKGSSNSKNYLTLNLGSQSCELTWLNVEDGVFEIKANHVSKLISGDAFTQMLVNHVVNEVQTNFGIVVIQSGINLYDLMKKCQQAKCNLSQDVETTIDLGMIDTQEVKLTITRDQFNEICKQQYEELLMLMQTFIQNTSMEIAAIEDVILIGSSTLIPGIQEVIKHIFSGKMPLISIHPQQIRAIGAVQQAYQLCNNSATNSVYPLIDQTQLSLGIETLDGVMTILVPCGTPTPVSKEMIVTTSTDSQTDILIKIFEGERFLTRDCIKRGEIHIQGIAVAPQGVPQIDVRFEIDSQSNITVKVKDLSSHNTSSIHIQNLPAHTSENLQNIIKDAELSLVEDENMRKQIYYKQQKDQLQKLLNFVAFSSFNDILSQGERDIVKESLRLLGDGIEVQIIMTSISPLLDQHQLLEELCKDGQNLVECGKQQNMK